MRINSQLWGTWFTLYAVQRRGSGLTEVHLSYIDVLRDAFTVNFLFLSESNLQIKSENYGLLGCDAM